MRHLLSLLRAAGIVVAFSLVSPAQAQNALGLEAPDFTRHCTVLSQMINDPFVEFDSMRCQIVDQHLKPQKPDLFKAIEARNCSALAVKFDNPNIATDKKACWAAGNKVLDSGEIMVSAARMTATLKQIISDDKATKLNDYCGFLANKYGKSDLAKDRKTNQENCQNFAQQQYDKDPAASLSEYRQFCQQYKGLISNLSQKDTERACPIVENYVKNALFGKQVGDEFASQQFGQTVRNWSIGLGITAAIVFFIFFFLRRHDKNKANQRSADHREMRDEYHQIAGSVPDQRAARIDEFFNKREGTLRFVGRINADSHGVATRLSRSLSSMEPKEILALRISHQLLAEELITADRFINIKYGIISTRGSVDQLDWFDKREQKDQRLVSAASAREWFTEFYRYPDSDGAISQALTSLQEAAAKASDHPQVKALLGLIKGGGSWLSPVETPNTPFADRGGNQPRLLLGGFKDGNEALWFTQGGALITVAPPGAGKTQCHVLTNLVNWEHAAIVLDVKDGELHAKTHGWRSTNVGPVYRFAPLDPSNSDCFNPLTFVRNDRLNIWEDARFLADMMMVRESGGSDKFWESRARDLLTAIIADACYGIEPALRTMKDLHGIANRVGWLEFIARLTTNKEVDAMREEGHSLEKIEDKVLDSVLQTLKVSLQPWAGQRVRDVTRKSDWDPLDLRGPDKPTIYMVMDSSQVTAFSSVLRVFIGLHLRALTAGMTCTPPAVPT